MRNSGLWALALAALLISPVACGDDGDEPTGDSANSGPPSTTSATATSTSTATTTAGADAIPMDSTGTACEGQTGWFPSDECNSCICSGDGELVGCTGFECDGPCDSGDVFPGGCPALCVEGHWQPIGGDSCSCDEGDVLQDECDVCTCSPLHMWECQSMCGTSEGDSSGS